MKPDLINEEINSNTNFVVDHGKTSKYMHMNISQAKNRRPRNDNKTARPRNSPDGRGNPEILSSTVLREMENDEDESDE